VVGVYARVSTLKQKDNYSLAVQKRRGSEFAQSQNEEYKIYEEAESGSSMIARKQLERLLSDIKNGLVKKVWAIEFTRISRSVEDLQIIKKIFKENGVELYINGSLTNLSLPDQRFIFDINAAVSEYERERIVERVKRGLSERKNLGIVHSPQIYGYQKKFDEAGNLRYQVVRDEAAVVRFIFRQRLRGWSLRQIAEHLNDRKTPTKHSCSWTRRGVLNILGHLIYTGYSTSADGTVIPSMLYPKIIRLSTFNQIWSTSHQPVHTKPSRMPEKAF
jgi:site-specific DNA recombinase